MCNSKFILSAIASLLLSVPFPCSAILKDDGYYRVQNYKTGRYIYVKDNKGTLDVATSSADMRAIELWRGSDKASSDPATVMYIEKNGTQYDVQAQSTGIYEIIGVYVNIREVSSTPGSYYIYGTKSGIAKYLSDGEQSNVDDGKLIDSGTGDYRLWSFTPISADADNYFGVAGDISVGGKYYTAFYADFPFSFSSSGMKAYYIETVNKGMAVLKEVGSSVIPKSTPVFIESSSALAKESKLNLGGTASATVQGNLLKGTYFCNSRSGHVNRVTNDKKTMRVLGVTSDGSLGFVTSNDTYLPANKSYLVVPEGTPEEVKVVTKEYYESVAGIDEIVNDENECHDVYTISGILVKKNATKEDVNNLKLGIYIVGDKKIIVRE